MKLVFTLAASALLATVPITASPINSNSFVDTTISKKDAVVVRTATIPYGDIHAAPVVVARQSDVSEASDETDSDVDESSNPDESDYAASDFENYSSDDEATDDDSTRRLLTTRGDDKCPASKMKYCVKEKCICIECIPDEQRRRCFPDYKSLPPNWPKDTKTKRLIAPSTSDSDHDDDHDNDLLPDHALRRRGSHTAEYWKTHSNPVAQGSHTSEYWKTHSNPVASKERRSPGHPGIKCTKFGEFPYCPPGITYRNMTVETCSCATYQYNATRKAHDLRIMGPAELDESDARNPKRAVLDERADESDKQLFYYGPNSKRDDPFRFDVDLKLPANIAKLIAPKKKRDLAGDDVDAPAPVVAERMTDLPQHDLLATRKNNGYGTRKVECNGYGMIAGFCTIRGECYCLYCDDFPRDCGFKLVKGVGDESDGSEDYNNVNELPDEGPFNMQIAIPVNNNVLGCGKSWGGLCFEGGCFCMVCKVGLNDCQMKQVRDAKPKRRREIGSGVAEEETRGDANRVHRISPFERPVTVSRRSVNDNDKRGGSNGVHRTSPFGRPGPVTVGRRSDNDNEKRGGSNGVHRTSPFGRPGPVTVGRRSGNDNEKRGGSNGVHRNSPFGRPGPVTVGRRNPLPIPDDHAALQKRESKGFICKDSLGAFCFAKDECFCFKCNKFPKDGCTFEKRNFFKKNSKREISNDTTVSTPSEEEQSEEDFKPGVVDIVYPTKTSDAGASAFTVTRNTEDVPNRNTTVLDREHAPKIFRRGKTEAGGTGKKMKSRSPAPAPASFGMHHAVPSFKVSNTTEQELGETVEAGEGHGAGRTDMHAVEKR
ncbi:hypothetical protein B0T20DRAFT_505650 [Sordaria brevicollis]|uniref:Uncharacterized protein n=1 Tax=Sordaria brevicollis TaxID=83679 RepID=A0AAE0PGU5_SORBR|nr:hypothetical protein B0T20DRAFT_505650 [Sordaria brevicollis]